ncbi:DNA polymerase beta superfamily protein [Pseudovibrio sp. SPO723]|uniref:DNA polymerase beta superfamily protein n=1 Tax=Nesiotobacter zosterae TaxID=392721 RepID=UPI0029C5D99B|nr:nucleotidyltransferase domain-containing protein [Pseudovibrio sp. SPO723]MDX5592083.1 nucleotidyltransferase domain-containing protein [Pseudovibrio sp. SPO723]
MPEKTDANISAATKEVLPHLERLATAHSICILQAANPVCLTQLGEGSTGFPSSRFVFVRSVEHYLSLFPKEEHIEDEGIDPTDIIGWDLRKALVAVLQGDPTAVDWLRITPTQISVKGFKDSFVGFAQEHGDPVRFAQSHLQLLLKFHRRFKGQPQGEMVPEKLIDLLRPALSLRWYSQHKLQGLPPAQLAHLLDDVFIRPVLRGEIVELLDRQRQGQLKDLEPIPTAVGELLLAEIEAGPALATRKRRPFTREIMQEADRFFLRWSVLNQR